MKNNKQSFSFTVSLTNTDVNKFASIEVLPANSSAPGRITGYSNGKKHINVEPASGHDFGFLDRMCSQGLVEFSVISWGYEEGQYYLTIPGATLLQALYKDKLPTKPKTSK